VSAATPKSAGLSPGCFRGAAKNNPVLICEPGVGKIRPSPNGSPIRIVAGEVPDSLKGIRRGSVLDSGRT